MAMLTPPDWWSYILRGAVAILFGLLALLSPWETSTALVLLFGAYVLIDGVIVISYAILGRRVDRRGRLALEGAIAVAIGTIAFLWPHLVALMLSYVVAAWAINTGILELAAMSWFKSAKLFSALLAASGISSILLGVALCLAPGAGFAALTWLLGAFAVIFGMLFSWIGACIHASSQSPTS